MTESGYFVIATFRRPVEHVASHLAWLKQMCSPGKEDFLAGHPAWVQEIARKLWKIDFASNEAIAAFFDSMTDMEAALFDNAQTRYLINIPGTKRVDKKDVALAMEMLGRVDLVGTTEHFDEFITLLSMAMNWPMPEQSGKLNTAGSKFGLDVNSRGFERAVEKVIWADRRIYEAALKRMLPQVRKYVLGVEPGQSFGIPNRDALGPVSAHLDVARPDWVSGWAIYKNRPDVPVAVRLFSMKTGRSWVRAADQFRSDLKQLNMHPTGQCGFVFSLGEGESLPADDEIIVAPMWSDKVFRRPLTA